MRPLPTLVFCLCLCTTAAFAQDDHTKASMQASIQALFGTDAQERPRDITVWMYPTFVGDGTEPAWRGSLSNGACASLASAYALCGKPDAAIAWLCAAFKNKSAIERDLVRTYPQVALQCLTGPNGAHGMGITGENGLEGIRTWLAENHPQPMPAPTNFASF